MSPKQIMLAGGAGVFLIAMLLVWILLIPPYNVPKFETIENNETGFLVPLDSDTNAQVRFESAEYLRDKKVAAKRVQIPRRWQQTGRMPSSGEYLDTMRLIKVDRHPVIREWTQDPHSGTSPHDDAISAQSKDGTGLRLSFTCTAYVPEADGEHQEGAEHFLYYYRGENLSKIMDQEVRARVQSVASEFCAKYILDELRGHQAELAKVVREDVIPFFKKRGISITNIGMVGGFHYINPGIQSTIDKTIQDQQAKVSAKAAQEKELVEAETKLNNQKIDNQTKLLNAEGVAAAKTAELEGQAKAKLAAAKVEAESNKVEAEGRAAATKIEADAESYKLEKLDKYRDLVLNLKAVEVEKAWRSLWSGGVPSTVINGAGGANIIPVLPFPSIPAPPPKK
jgi:hypothetical protein